MGALDGTHRTGSVTKSLEMLNWKRILVEANPIHRKALSLNHDAYCVSAAVCSVEQKVHYISQKTFSGILEFMAPIYLQKFFPILYQESLTLSPSLPLNSSQSNTNTTSSHNNSTVTSSPQTPSLSPNILINETATTISISQINFTRHRNYITEIDCFSLTKIFSAARITHIDLFILDIEGGEYNVLQGLNWNIITFSVMIIETDQSNRREGYQEDVTALLLSHGYVYDFTIGRNSFYHHSDYIPITNPLQSKECYRGYEMVLKRRQKWGGEIVKSKCI